MTLNIIGEKYGKLLVIERLPSVKTHRSHSLHKCICDCGREAVIRTVHLRSGHTSSCGCLRYNLDDDAALQHVLYIYKRNAKKANRIFELTYEEFKTLTSSNCYYCNQKPSKTVRKITHQYVYNGIDRLNNEVGYILSNCVPCCESCNRMKGSMNHKEFIEQCRQIIIYQDLYIQ